MKDNDTYIFDWSIYSSFGEVKAKDMQDAIHQVVDRYFNFPYPSYDSLRIEIRCKKRESI